MENSNKFEAMAPQIVLLAMDCDGVLTDGRLYYGKDGEMLKAFHVHDGQGIVSWRNAGFKTAVISARTSEMLSVRAAELGVDFLAQGVKDKAEKLNEICAQMEIGMGECAFVGDDIADVSVMKAAGLSFAVSDATMEARRAASMTTSKNGGMGAIREVVEWLLEFKQ